MKKPLRIGAYIRVSTDKQVQVFEGSLDTQKYRMREFVKSRNKETHQWGEIVDFYIEEGLSAGTDKRPEYQRMISDIRENKIDLILVADISRLSRSVHDFSVLLKVFEKYDVSYLSLKEQFDTTTPSGRLMTNMVVTMAQFEREQTSERVLINTNARALRGLVNGGRPPLGLRRTDKPGVWEVDELEAEQVRKMFKIFLEQGSLRKTMPMLEELGIKPKNGVHVAKGKQSRTWNPMCLLAHLSNHAYIGKREINRNNKNVSVEILKPWQQYQVADALWKPIIDEQTFLNVQELLKDNAQVERRRQEKSGERVFLLSGILRCNECGRSLSGQSAHGKKNVHLYYGHSDKRVKRIDCSLKRIRAEEIEQVVIKHFVSMATSDEYFAGIEKKLQENVKASVSHEMRRPELLRKELGTIEAEISATFRFQSSTPHGPESLSLISEQLEALAVRKRNVIATLEKAESVKNCVIEASENIKSFRLLVEEFKRGFVKSSPAMRRRLVRKIIHTITVQKNRLDISFHFEKKFEANPDFQNNLVELSDKKTLRSGCSDLSLLSAELPVVKVGWGTRTRT